MTAEPVRRLLKPAIVIALSAGYAIYCLLNLPPGPVTAPDTPGYLTFSPIRSLGYPVFLKLLGSWGVMIAQPVLFSAALAAIGLETFWLTSSLLLSAAVVIAPMVIPEFRTYHYSLLTESPFASLMLACFACVLSFVRSPSRGAVASASVLASVAATLRNAGLAFLPVVMLMILIDRRRTASHAAWLVVALVPAVVILGGERVAARAIHGERLTTILGRHMFSKAALIDAPRAPQPSADPQRARFDDELDVYFAPMRQIVAAAPPRVAPVLRLFYEVCLQGPCVPELGTTEPGDTPKALNHLLEDAGLARMARAPGGVALLAVGEYRSLWTAFRLGDPVTVAEWNAFVAAHRPLPFEALVFKVGPNDSLDLHASSLVRVVQPAVVALGWLTCSAAVIAVGAGFARRELPSGLAAAGLVSLGVHGALVFTAILAAGIGRFMLAVWPGVTTGALLGLWGLAMLVRDVREARRARHHQLHLEQLDKGLRA